MSRLLHSGQPMTLSTSLFTPFIHTSANNGRVRVWALLGHASLFLQCTTARIPNSTNITLSSLLCDRLSRSNSREITEKPASLHPVNSLLVTYSLAAEEVGHYPFQSEGMQFRRLLKFSQFPWPLLNIYKNTRTFESIAI